MKTSIHEPKIRYMESFRFVIPQYKGMRLHFEPKQCRSKWATEKITTTENRKERKENVNTNRHQNGKESEAAKTDEIAKEEEDDEKGIHYFIMHTRSLPNMIGAHDQNQIA